jgi:hypothetical protein
MTCAEAARLILEADPQELEGTGDGSLAAHIRGCPQCGAMAQTVLKEEESMAAEMAAAVPMPDIDRLLQEAEASGGGETIPFRRKARRLGLSMIPVAAAAAIVSLLLLPEPQIPGDPYSPPEALPGLGLEVPEGQNVAVLATNNPNITVLWFF